MYEQAAILDYKGKKIWIKHINRQLYCVNGRYILFNPKQNIEDVSVIAYAVDEWYSPFHKRTKDTEIVVFHSLENDDAKFLVGRSNLLNCSYDVSNAESIRHEYEVWVQTMSKDQVYINDCREMDLGQWLIQDLSVRR